MVVCVPEEGENGFIWSVFRGAQVYILQYIERFPAERPVQNDTLWTVDIWTYRKLFRIEWKGMVLV